MWGGREWGRGQHITLKVRKETGPNSPVYSPNTLWLMGSSLPGQPRGPARAPAAEGLPASCSPSSQAGVQPGLPAPSSPGELRHQHNIKVTQRPPPLAK